MTDGDGPVGAALELPAARQRGVQGSAGGASPSSAEGDAGIPGGALPQGRQACAMWRNSHWKSKPPSNIRPDIAPHPLSGFPCPATQSDAARAPHREVFPTCRAPPSSRHILPGLSFHSASSLSIFRSSILTSAYATFFGEYDTTYAIILGEYDTRHATSSTSGVAQSSALEGLRPDRGRQRRRWEGRARRRRPRRCIRRARRPRRSGSRPRRARCRARHGSYTPCPTSPRRR